MTRRPSRVGRSRDGLFWNPGGAGAVVVDNPLLRPCSHLPCRAGAGEPCRVRGRVVAMTGYHDNRTRATLKSFCAREVPDGVVRPPQ